MTRAGAVEGWVSMGQTWVALLTDAHVMHDSEWEEVSVARLDHLVPATPSCFVAVSAGSSTSGLALSPRPGNRGTAPRREPARCRTCGKCPSAVCCASP